MVYAQFFHDSTGWNGTDFSGPVQIIECVGSDGVYPLDARKSLHNQKRDAEAQAGRLNKGLNKGIKGYKIMRGRSYSDSKPVTELVTIHPEG